MPSSSLQPHTFSLHFYSSFCLFLLLLFYRLLWPALLPAVCPGAFTRHGWGSSTLFPCPMSSEGHSLPPVCHLALLPAVQPAPHHPSAQENSAYEQQKSHRARITYQQNRIPAETPSPACFGAYACLTLALARERAKRQRITLFLWIKWHLQSICLLHILLPSSNPIAPCSQREQLRPVSYLKNFYLLLKSCSSEVRLVRVPLSVRVYVSVWLSRNL